MKTFNTIAANDYNETLKHLYNSMEFIVNNDARNLSDAGKANIRRAQAAIQKMKLMTDDIIEFSKIHSEEQMTSVDLNEALVAVLSGLDQRVKAEKAVIVFSFLDENALLGFRRHDEPMRREAAQFLDVISLLGINF